MVFLWFSYGFPMVFLWFSYGFPMVSIHFYMVSPWFSIDGPSGAEERAPDAGLCRPQSPAAGDPARTPGGGGTLVAGPCNGKSQRKDVGYPLVNIQKAIENGHL